MTRLPDPGGYEDLIDVTDPVISVLTPSLNHNQFLRQTIESVASQTFRNFEHIVVDGASMDGSVETLKQYPHLRVISEKDECVVEAYRKGLAMARGRYVIQCCVSDGFLNRDWFRRCAAMLDDNETVSLVWGFAQEMSEEGDLLNVCHQEYFSSPPPQQQDFLAYWLATGFALPEGNYCVRRGIIDQWFPDERSDECFRTCPHLGFMYSFFTQGYCPLFVPVVANFGRQHHDQRSRRLKAVEGPAIAEYLRRIGRYADQLANGTVVHRFRNGRGEIMGELDPNRRPTLKRLMRRHRLMSSPWLRRDLYSIALGLRRRIQQRFPG